MKSKVTSITQSGFYKGKLRCYLPDRTASHALTPRRDWTSGRFEKWLLYIRDYKMSDPCLYSRQQREGRIRIFQPEDARQ